MQTYLFYILSAFIIVLSLVSIISKKPFSSIISFGGMFVFVLGLLILMDASFMGFLQLFAWGGFTTFLFLIAVMVLRLHQWKMKPARLSLYQYAYVMIVPTAYYLFQSLIAMPTFSDVDVDENFGGFFTLSNAMSGHYAFLVGVSALVLLVSVFIFVVLPQWEEKEGAS